MIQGAPAIVLKGPDHPEVIAAYHRLHELGYAHSIEVWDDKNELVGGMYGVAQGTLFCGESMFSRAINASKTALLVFCERFARSGGKLVDCRAERTHRLPGRG